MKRKFTIYLNGIAALLLLVCMFCSTNSYSAFVPANRQPAHIKPTVKPENAWLKLAFMSNRDIERMIGRKLSFKEKISLIVLKRNIRKNYKNTLNIQPILTNDCFTMYLKNGEVLEVKLLQITPTEVKYQRCNKPGDPEIIISKSDIFSIKDKAGEVIYSSRNEDWKRGEKPDTRKVEGLSLASGILGIGSLTIGLFIWPLGMAAGITGLILGLISLKGYRNNREARGQGWAITGIVAGGLWSILGILILLSLVNWL